MKKTISIILAILLALCVLCGCNNDNGTADGMTENGTVSDGDGVIGNENNNNDHNDHNDSTLTMPTVTMPSVTTPNTNDNHRDNVSDTAPLDNVL